MRRFSSAFLAALALGVGSPAVVDAAPRAPKERLVLELSCTSLAPLELARHADCHSARIMIKKAFFDSPLPVRLGNPKEGEPHPLLDVQLLIYRKAAARPDQGEGVFEWRYRGLALWRVLDAEGAPVAGGFADADSGREFMGGANSAYDPSRVRGPILRAVAAQLPDRVYSALRAVGVTPGGAPPVGRADRKVEVRLRGQATGVCAERLAGAEGQAMLEGALGAATEAVLSAPELSGAEGPWQATVFACTDKPSELRLRLRGKALKAEAACPLEEPLTLSGPEGIAAQCAQILATGLRTEILQASHDRK